MKAEERKKQILEAALKAFAEYGYERTSIAIICERAGIARPTLYQYFKDKRSVFRELLELHLFGIHEKIHARQEAMSEKKAFSEQESMQFFHKELLKEISGNQDFFRIFFKEAKARNAETEDIVKGILQGHIHEFIEEMRSDSDWEIMSEEDMEFTVLYMIGGMMQTVEYYLFDNEHPLSIEKLSEKITFIESRIKGV